MNKQIYLAIGTRLQKNIAALKWIGYDFGQLDVAYSSTDRPPVVFPCVLIDISYPNTTDMNAQSGDQKQKVSAQIILKVAFNPLSDRSNMGAPDVDRLLSLSPLDTVADIHATLQAWNGSTDTTSALFRQLSRSRAVPVPRPDGIKLYEITYDTTFIDIP
jgi:hypothetical protein